MKKLSTAMLAAGITLFLAFWISAVAFGNSTTTRVSVKDGGVPPKQRRG
jgi:hypothetical protein